MATTGWSFEDLYKTASQQFDTLRKTFQEERSDADLSVLLAPVDPYNRSPVLTPIVAAAGVVGLVMLSGLAVAGFAVAMAALFAVYFLLTEVFGFQLALTPFPV